MKATKMIPANPPNGSPAPSLLKIQPPTNAPTIPMMRSGSAGSSDHPQQEEQYNRADEGHENDPGQSPERHSCSQLAEDPTTHERADDPDDDVADQAVACSPHHQRRKNAGDQSHDDPCQNAHRDSSAEVGFREALTVPPAGPGDGAGRGPGHFGWGLGVGIGPSPGPGPGPSPSPSPSRKGPHPSPSPAPRP